jgi:3-deoxy-D-manno-octulosonic-acid transferase
MIWIYRLLFPVVMLVMSPRYLLRMRRRGGYADGFRHRFGSFPPIPARTLGVKRVWLQAVSVGEMLAIEPILKELKASGTEVILTTTTSTGFRLAVEKFRPYVLAVAYFPIDWAPFSARAWERVNPDLAIVAEGERWPEHMHQARRRGIRVMCINARISDRSLRRLRRFPPAASFVLGGIDRTLASSAHDADNFLALGYPAGRLSVTGNIKLDVKIPLLGDDDRSRLRGELGLPADLPVVLGSSTWPGEETALIEALIAARARGVAYRLMIVPRHAERRQEIEVLLSASGLSHHFRSRGGATGAVDVSVADTTGELRSLAQLADVVFVGKSLPPHTEGQTPVEAAILGKPVLMGPGMSNFKVIARDLLECGAAATVSDPADLDRQIGALIGDPAERKAMAAAASSWRNRNGGAVDRTLEAIRGELAGAPRAS